MSNLNAGELDLLNELKQEVTTWLNSNVPADAHTIIVAEKWEKDPDDDSSLFAEEQHIIGYHGDIDGSLSLRMYNAGRNFPATRHLIETSSCTETVSGPYKCISGPTTTGWKIRSYFMPGLETTDLAFVLQLNSISLGTAATPEQPQNSITNTERLTFQNNTIEIIDYSAKSFVIKGNTKPYKDQLGKNGLKGLFNNRLTDQSSGETFAGWIFPTSKREEIILELKKIFA